MREESIEGRIIRLVQDAGGFCRRMAWRGRNGAPDLLAVLDGRVCFFEVKTRAGRVSAVQAVEHERMRAAGARVFVVRDAEKALAILRGEGA